jgi:hypothetical protein
MWAAALEAGHRVAPRRPDPAFKEAVERCFVEGLVKVVFATETLALGINMPARSVVIEKLTKYNGDTHEFLTPAQFTQLTGRAGRRGIDDEGFSVVLWSPFVSFAQVAASPAAASSRSRRRSGPPTTWPPTWSAGTRRPRPCPSWDSRLPSSRPIGRPRRHRRLRRRPRSRRRRRASVAPPVGSAARTSAAVATGRLVPAGRRARVRWWGACRRRHRVDPTTGAHSTAPALGGWPDGSGRCRCVRRVAATGGSSRHADARHAVEPELAGGGCRVARHLSRRARERWRRGGGAR